MATPKNKTYSAEFLERKELSTGVYQITFVLKDNFEYKPGQYVWIDIPNLKYEDKSGSRRAFSIIKTSNPEHISILFRMSESGYKKTLIELEAKQEVSVIGPFGNSFCLPDSDQDIVLIAGGVGIAPFITLTRFAKEQNLKNKITVFYQDRFKESAQFAEEILNLNTSYKNHKGYITDTFSEKYLEKIKYNKKTIFYVSGSQSFIDFVNEILLKNNVLEQQLRFENFYPTLTHIKKFQELFEGYLSGDSKIEDQNLGGILFSAIEGSANHTIITDANGIIVFANQAAQEITGFTFEEMKNNTPRLWGGLMSDEFYKKLWKCKIEGTSLKTELVNRRKDGTLYNVLANITTVRNKEGKVIGFIGNEEDITVIKNKEEELLKRTNEAEFLNKVTVGRELKMIELKEEIKTLKQKLDENK